MQYPPIRTDRAGLGFAMTFSTLCVVWGLTQLLFHQLVEMKFDKDGLRILVFGLLIRHVVGQITKQPRNNPAIYLRGLQAQKSKGENSSTSMMKPRFVCLGDSLTHGHCSSSWVDSIESQLSSTFDVVNAGQNSITSWTIANERLDDVILCKPKFVTILIGTNDVRGLYNNLWALHLEKTWNLPANALCINTYRTNLNRIVSKILDSTNANIGLLTLPPIGERLESRSNCLVEKANKVIREIAVKHDDRVHLIDIFEILSNGIKQSPSSISLPVDMSIFLALLVEISFHIFSIPRNVTSRVFGYRVLSDGIHLNENGASLVAKMIFQWAKENNEVYAR